MEQFNNDIVLQINNLKVARNDQTVLKNINMVINYHDVVALVGPSGHGKSILPRAINQLFPMDATYRVSGEILLENQSIEKLTTEKIRQNIGMIFSAPNLFPVSVYENIAFGLRLIGIVNKAALDKQIRLTLEQVHLWDELAKKLHQPINKLTIDQQQLLCLARTLALQPKVILMEKPTMSLSSGAKSRFENLILELKQKYTIMLSVEDKQQAGRISDKVAFLYNGRLIEYGHTNNMFTQPREELTENYMTGRIS